MGYCDSRCPVFQDRWSYGQGFFTWFDPILYGVSFASNGQKFNPLV